MWESKSVLPGMHCPSQCDRGLGHFICQNKVFPRVPTKTRLFPGSPLRAEVGKPFYLRNTGGLSPRQLSQWLWLKAMILELACLGVIPGFTVY